MDGADDRRHERIDALARRVRHGRQDRRPEVADTGQRVEPARLRERTTDLRRDATRASWRGSSSASLVAKIVPVSASPTVPPTGWKKVRLLVAVPSCSTGDVVLDDQREDRERRTDAEAGHEHPGPQDRDRRVGARCVSMNSPTAISASAPNMSSR